MFTGECKLSYKDSDYTPSPRNVVLIQIRLGLETRQEAVTAKPQFALI